MPEEHTAEAPVAADAADIGRVIAGRYRVTRLIGEGGMAVVYEGEHTEIGKRVAIKIVHALFSGEEEIIRRFRREARSASAIESEHIIHVFDAGHDPAVGFYMVMELLKGEDLAKVLLRERQLDAVFACGLVKQAARALEKAHEAGIVHRDLKPANVFLTRRDDGSTLVKVVDFGIAKVIRDANEAREGKNGITRRGMAIGTPQYMSPEQAQGLESIDHRTDVYSLGAVLWEAVAGQPLVEERPTYEQTILQILGSEPRRLSDVVPDVPPALDALVAGMLERDVDKRVPNMHEVRERLEAIFPELRGSSIKLKSVRPPSSSGEYVQAALASAPTSPAVSLNTSRRKKKRAATTTRWIVAIASAAVLASGVIVWIEWPARTAPPAAVLPAAVTPSAAPMPTPAPTPSAIPTPNPIAVVSATPAPTPSIVAPARPSRPAANTGAAVPTPPSTNRPVGGTGISSQF